MDAHLPGALTLGWDFGSSPSQTVGLVKTEQGLKYLFVGSKELFKAMGLDPRHYHRIDSEKIPAGLSR